MLREIHIQNYAVIDKLELELHGGLNVLTGETGSGKSILVDALGLALGERASADIIRTGEERAVVTAVFRADDSGSKTTPWQKWFDEVGLAGGDDSELILRREIHSNGKSRLLVNDQPVTMAAVKNLAGVLVEIHGQSEHVQLLGRDAQLNLLDQFAGCGTLLEKTAETFARWRELERQLAELSQNEQDRLRRIDLLSFQVRELEQARLEPGEDARLEEEKTLLANLEKVRASAGSAYHLLYEDEGSASARIAAAGRALDELLRYDASFGVQSEPLASARATIDDLAISLRDYLGKLNAQPHRLEEVEDRLALLDRLKRKYGKTIEEVLQFLETSKQQLDAIQHADARRAEVERELEKALSDYRRAAGQLSERREESAQKMAKLVREELAQVGMEKTRFEIHFESMPDDRATAHGTDDVEYRISPNPGEELRALERIASGGELSRLMLALKTVAGGKQAGGRKASRPALPAFVFDEIDAGIGGRVAEAVGQRLRRLGRQTQVLCVTHLAQIACFADHHFFVEKSERAGRTVTSVQALPRREDRTAELARMLSGSRITDAALKHAQAMLQAVTSDK